MKGGSEDTSLASVGVCLSCYTSWSRLKVPVWKEPVATVSISGWMLTGLFVIIERFAEQCAMAVWQSAYGGIFFFFSKDDVTSLHGFN